MKKLLLPLAIALLLALAVPAAFADAELGIGLTPGQVGGYNDASAPPLINFHVGYTWTILYFGWDAYAMPSYWVYNNYGYVDPNTGDAVPGFLNLFDVGLKLYLRPFVAYLGVGPDMLYVRGGGVYNGVGVNARLGAGLRFGWWGIDISGTQVFASWNDLTFAFQEAAANRWDVLLNGMVATVTFNIYF